MTLLDVVRDLGVFDVDATIYAKEPWSAEAEAAVVEWTPFRSPPDLIARGLIQFMSVEMARDFLGAWLGSVSERPSLQEQCARLIHYSVFDA